MQRGMDVPTDPKIPSTSSPLTRRGSPMRSTCLMPLRIVTLLFLALVDTSVAIQCYKCSVTAEKYSINNNTITTPMCSKFDESDEYIADCSYSTMCLKTISTLYLQNGQQQETITRGCAQQKETTQVFRNRQWQQEHSVQEVYKEGCEEIKGNNLAGALKTHCYCRGNLCNAAQRTTIHSTFKATGTVILLIVFIQRAFF